MSRETRMTARVLVVDDEAVIASTLEEFLTNEGYSAAIAGDAERALELLDSFEPDVVLADVQLPGNDGLELLGRMLEVRPDLIVFMITAYGTVETAVAAFRRGAHDYLMKPVLFDDLSRKLERALETRRLSTENRALRGQLASAAWDLDQLVGASRVMNAAKSLLRKVAPTRSTVLVTGESGTGKELAARALHGLGPEPSAPFVPVNVAAIPTELLESQLFGHKRGSFTGADRDQPGLFVAAGRGTLFLDEIGELPPSAQAKLLRVIEQHEVLPVGAVRPARVEARVVAATNRELAAAVDAGDFRSDLYFRLNVVHVVMPPLREHPEDIPEIARVLVRRLSRRLGRRIDGIDDDAVDALAGMRWKGNVRELENVLERAIILTDANRITLADLPGSEASAPIAAADDGDDLRSALARAEQTHIERVLAKAGGDKREAASRLGLGLSSLYRKLEEFRVARMSED